MGEAQPFRQLFDHLPDVDYFAKDVEGRFVAISKGMLRRIGLENEEEGLGVHDATIHPPHVARAIRADDLMVMRTRQPLIDRVEALYARSRAKDWFVTTKLPIIDSTGEVIGIMGFVRPYRGARGPGVDDLQVRRVVDYIQEHCRDKLAVADLARLAHISARHLHRRFQETFRISVQEFIVRTRIQAACDDLLASDRSIGEIAVTHGFYDQSAFTRHFRKRMGETPLAYRRRRVKTLI